MVKDYTRLNKEQLKERYIYTLRDKTAQMLLDLNNEFKEIDGFNSEWQELTVKLYNEEYRKIKNLILYFPQYK